ncbi:putative glutathione S-transferase [Luteimonas sp. J16]|jgi:putative glutathione S-transferase|uniref:glutathione S-transferase family protein n=1 Tax=unclassified Luteimonas TaxID=2629088 RepID=UPI00047C7EA1|nr:MULTISPECIES: glutathione S-transferase family protein [unclassified Luteimonas]TWG93132.1 putative glutathione S-transferase [Luteimonas sp. J16]
MGMLVDGRWTPQGKGLTDARGRLRRPDSAFRHWITPDGSPGPTGEGGFRAEPGRYHLYVSRACPWAHRTTIFRELKGLQEIVGLSVTHWLMAEDGWTFRPGPGVVPDPLFGVETLWQLYVKSDPAYTGRVSVPVLWDKARGCIVSNESADILRMFNSAFDGVGAREGDYSPPELRGEIDAVNRRVYDGLNNGVYKAGFATSQEAYDEAVAVVFETLDWLEQRLSGQQWLVGGRLTEADWRLFTTLLRFDAVYHGHFKCNVRRLVDYPALWAYTRRLYAHPAVAPTVDFDHIRRHYYQSHRHINPTGIVPAGPLLDFSGG